MSADGQNQGYVSRSVMLEMETFVSALCGHYTEKETPNHLIELIQQVPASLSTELRTLLGRKRLFSFLDYAATVAEVLEGNDYDQSSMAIRSLTIDQAVQRFREKTMPLDLGVSEDLSNRAELVALITQAQRKLFAGVGKELSNRRMTIIDDDAQLAASILADGELHQRFWMLLDRLYYQYWEPFRSKQLDRMRLMESSVNEALKGHELTSETLHWLPGHNPLRTQPELLAGIEKMGLKVMFWSEPIGLPDTWSITPETFCVSFAESGPVLDAFRRFAESISQKVSALSDPTRLTILRLIREFGMYNTEIASFLGLARPTVSNHAKILREAGLITTRRENGKALHEINGEQVAELFEDLKRFLDLDG